MAATAHLTGVLGVSSPPLAPSHCSCSGAKKQSCSLRQGRQQRRRLRVARAVEVDAPSAGAPEPEEAEEPSVDFAFVSVSSCRDSSFFFSFGIAEIERALRAHDVRALVTGGRLGLEAAA
jgi:hypothetical protein